MKDMHRPSCVVSRKEIEGDRILWNVGNTSCRERGGLGDKSVQGKGNQ